MKKEFFNGVAYGFTNDELDEMYCRCNKRNCDAMHGMHGYPVCTHEFFNDNSNGRWIVWCKIHRKDA